jgi:hypothetical protein
VSRKNLAAITGFLIAKYRPEWNAEIREATLAEIVAASAAAPSAPVAQLEAIETAWQAAKARA